MVEETAMQNLGNWDLIVATLFHSGSANLILSPVARVRVWVKGDGYGKMTAAQLKRLHLIEDWSHIRDSSDEAQAAIAEQIRAELRAMDRARSIPSMGLVLPDGHHEGLVSQVVSRLGVRR